MSEGKKDESHKERSEPLRMNASRRFHPDARYASGVRQNPFESRTSSGFQWRLEANQWHSVHSVALGALGGTQWHSVAVGGGGNEMQASSTQIQWYSEAIHSHPRKRLE